MRVSIGRCIGEYIGALTGLYINESRNRNIDRNMYSSINLEYTEEYMYIEEYIWRNIFGSI